MKYRNGLLETTVWSSVLLVLLVLGAPSHLFAEEPLTGYLLEPRRISAADPERETLQLRFTHLLPITLDDPRFIDAFELEIAGPPRLQEGHITVAALLFGEIAHNILEESPDRRIQTRARRLHFMPAEESERKFLRVSVQEPAPPPGGRADSVADLPATAYPVVFRLAPLGKGISDEALDSPFEVTIHTVARNEGAVSVDFHAPPESDRLAKTEDLPPPSLTNARLFLNGEEPRIDEDRGEIIAPTGFQSLRVEAPGYTPVRKTVGVQQGTVTSTTLSLEFQAATLYLDAPPGTRLFLDGTVISDRIRTETEIRPGIRRLVVRRRGTTKERYVRFRVGESYHIEIRDNEDGDYSIMGIETEDLVVFRPADGADREED